jgi:hypothetical protein
LTLVGEIEVTTGQTTCRHHWSIEATNGLVSGAVCKYCHEERTFQNSMRGIDTTRLYVESLNTE